MKFSTIALTVAIAAAALHSATSLFVPSPFFGSSSVSRLSGGSSFSTTTPSSALQVASVTDETTSSQSLPEIGPDGIYHITTADQHKYVFNVVMIYNIVMICDLVAKGYNKQQCHVALTVDC
jgi:hypothetical protein